MAEQLQLNRIKTFYGGITSDDKSTTVGVCSNLEEMDIFSNGDYMQPNTIFGAEETITRQITGYTLGDMNDITVGGTLYALGRDASGTPLAEIWRKTSADSTSPSAWVSVKTSAYASNAKSPIIWHRITAEVTSITRADTTATITTTLGHGLTTNNIIAITVAGCDQVAYNGTFKGTVTGANTITYTVSGSPTTPATTLLAGGITVSFACLYYVTGTQQLTRAEITDSTSPAAFSESLTDTASTPNGMVLSGLGSADDRIPMLRYNGEVFIGHGRYIATVDDNGVMSTYAYTLPSGWKVVSMAPFAHNMAILAKSVVSGDNHSKIFYWDIVSPTDFVDEVFVPHGGPQIIVNLKEALWVICAINGTMNTYRVTDKIPNYVHSLGNVATETDAQAIIPDATKFISNGILYFGLYKTDKSGLYAIGQVDDQKPYALLLAKRFHNAAVTSITSSGTTATVTTTTVHGLSAGDSVIISGADQSAYNGVFKVATAPTTATFTYTTLSTPSATPATGTITCTTKSYSTHVPYAAIGVGDNFYASFSLNGTPTCVKGEGASQVRSSNATYESIWLDLGSPEAAKDWVGFLLGTSPVASGCGITVDARTDGNTTSDDTHAAGWDTSSAKQLTTSNDQTDSGVTIDTFWMRDWVSLYGRMIMFRLRFTSSTTSAVKIYYMSLLSRANSII